jgi:hypothetical protein
MDEGTGQAEEGYDGPAEIELDGGASGALATIADVVLRGALDPAGGRYRWWGRVSAASGLAEALAAGSRTGRIRTPGGQADATFGDVDPWGRARVEGSGAPPFGVDWAVPPRDRAPGGR